MKQRRLLIWRRSVFLLVALFGLFVLFGCSAKASNGFLKNDGTLTLHLDVPHESFAMKPAADLPPGVINVQLPLHPQAQVSNQPFVLADKSTPVTPYLKAASAEFVLPVSEKEAQKWYDDHMSAAHFEQEGTGQIGNSKTGEHEDSTHYFSMKDSALHVVLSFERVKPDQTLLMYWAYEVVQPPRPADSLLPTDMSKVDIQYHPADRSKAIVQKTITDPASLQKLVTAINSLPLDLSGPRSCLEDSGQGATLHFVEAKGQTFDVRLRVACKDVSINHGRPMYDVNDTVWTTVTALIEKP